MRRAGPDRFAIVIGLTTIAVDVSKTDRPRLMGKRSN
jgi:hypothetical protein